MRGGTTDTSTEHSNTKISIHPPHAGRDRFIIDTQPRRRYFNPPSPCGEGRDLPILEPEAEKNFNPPSPCGEGPHIVIVIHHRPTISIHPPHAGRDAAAARIIRAHRLFQSTLPMRGGTPPPGPVAATAAISIHPPHAGRDFSASGPPSPDTDFNPPSPCGEGQTRTPRGTKGQLFQSTLPMRGGTFLDFNHKGFLEISIHPPHAGRDLKSAMGSAE